MEEIERYAMRTYFVAHPYAISNQSAISLLIVCRMYVDSGITGLLCYRFSGVSSIQRIIFIN